MKHILLVEDDQDVIDALVTVLGDMGYGVSTARNGEQALELLRSGFRPAIILLDLMMPVMNGYTFRIRQLGDPSIADLPVVVVTAGVVDDRAREIRPSACLTKPFDLDALLQVITAINSDP